MWKKTSAGFGPADSRIVTKGFILAEGTTSSYPSFSDRNENPFGRDFYAPVFYLFKVHRNHPMKIFSAAMHHCNIYPSNERKKERPRMSADVNKDKMDYDLATFMFVPYENPDTGDFWKKFPIKEGFVSEESGPIQDISLLYLNHGASLHSQDNLKVSEIMPSQVLKHLSYWLKNPKEIYSHNNTFKRKLEGEINVKGLDITAKLISMLEKRFNTRLTFDEDRGRFPDLWNV